MRVGAQHGWASGNSGDTPMLHSLWTDDTGIVDGQQWRTRLGGYSEPATAQQPSELVA
jgi:hypothetical protein